MPAGEDPDSIVRSKGKTEFEKRISAAREFFDYWIEREVAATDLSSVGTKVQLARKLADTVSAVHKPDHARGNREQSLCASRDRAYGVRSAPAKARSKPQLRRGTQ